MGIACFLGYGSIASEAAYTKRLFTACHYPQCGTFKAEVCASLKSSDSRTSLSTDIDYHACVVDKHTAFFSADSSYTHQFKACEEILDGRLIAGDISVSADRADTSTSCKGKLYTDIAVVYHQFAVGIHRTDSKSHVTLYLDAVLSLFDGDISAADGTDTNTGLALGIDC